VTVHAVAPIPGFGSAFFATGGNGVVSGVVARKNNSFPTGPWPSDEECCLGTTAMAFSVRSRQLQTFAADINCSGNLSVQDLFGFLGQYFAGAPNSDFNFSGQASVQDIFDFLACYFGGCAMSNPH